MTVSRGLNPETKHPNYAICRFPREPSSRIFLVDTPSFDQDSEEDYQILKWIVKWMEISFDERMKVGGIIYLSEVDQRRLPLLDRPLPNSILRVATSCVTTMGGFGRGRGVHFDNTQQSAWDIIGSVLRRGSDLNVLQIRTELAQVISQLWPEKRKRGWFRQSFS